MKDQTRSCWASVRRFGWATLLVLLPSTLPSGSGWGHTSSRSGATAPKPPDRRADDRAILALVIAKRLGKDRRQCVVVEESVPLREFRDLLRQARGPWGNLGIMAIPTDAEAELQRRNGRASRLPNFAGRQPLLFSGRKTLDTLDRADHWKSFYEQFPESSGYWEFALPGYSRDGSTAVIYFSHSAGLWEMESTIFLLRKVNGKWRTADSRSIVA